MSKRVEFKLNPGGIMELFKSPEVNSWLQEVGDNVAGIASDMSGEEYEARAHNADRTAVVNIFPASREAALDNYRNNTLEKALGTTGLPRKKKG